MADYICLGCRVQNWLLPECNQSERLPPCVLVMQIRVAINAGIQMKMCDMSVLFSCPQLGGDTTEVHWGNDMARAGDG